MLLSAQKRLHSFKHFFLNLYSLQNRFKYYYNKELTEQESQLYVGIYLFNIIIEKLDKSTKP